jgi:methyl-accepting chemotaxis protein
MKRCISSSRRVTLAVISAMVLTASGSVLAQSVDQVLKADQRRLTLAQQSQERINKVVESTRSLEDQYRAINKEVDGLRVYNRLMAAQTDGQNATLEDIALSMDQVDVINRQIFPLMTSTPAVIASCTVNRNWNARLVRPRHGRKIHDTA